MPPGPRSTSPRAVWRHRAALAAGADVGVTAEQLVEYSNFIGLDPKRHDLLWIAEQGLRTPPPSGWAVVREGGQPCYVSPDGESVWDHPVDGHWKRIASAFSREPCQTVAPVTPVFHRSVRSVGTQLGRQQTADSCSQAAVVSVDAEVQVPSGLVSTGVGPMPVSKATSTHAEAMHQATMTAAVPDLASPRLDVSRLASPALTGRCSRLPDDLSVSSRLFRTRHHSEPVEMAHSGVQPSPDRGSVQGEAAPTAASPAEPHASSGVETLMREMVGALQHQLRQHRRETLDVVRRDCGRIADTAEAAAPPAPAEKSELVAELPSRPGDWTRGQWVLCCVTLLAAHVILSFAAVLSLPGVLGGSGPLRRDAERLPSQYW